jgi:hypothetical protein
LVEYYFIVGFRVITVFKAHLWANFEFDLRRIIVFVHFEPTRSYDYNYYIIIIFTNKVFVNISLMMAN